MEELATKLNAQPMDSSFVDWVLHSQAFQDCIKMTHDEDAMARWFYDFVECDEARITASCHDALRQLLTFLEAAIFGGTVLDGKKCISFEKTIFDFYLSEEFDILMSELPGPLAGNRTAALCLFESMLSLFENWVYDSVTEIANLRRGADETNVTIDDYGVIKMMQKIVGAGINKAIKKFSTSSSPNDPVAILLNNVCCKRGDDVVDAEYKRNWYPQHLQFEDKGKLCGKKSGKAKESRQQM